MKFLVILFLPLLFISCLKEDIANERYSNDTNIHDTIPSIPHDINPNFDTIKCIDRVVSMQEGGYNTEIIDQDEYNQIRYLFQQNQLNYSNSFIQDFSADSNNVFDGKHLFSTVRLVKFSNHLPLLSNNVVYTFKDAFLTYKSNDDFSISDPDTISRLTLDYLLELYNFKCANDWAASYISIPCVSAEFGYYDLNSSSNSPPNYVKAWKLYPSGRNWYSMVPLLFVNDNNGEAIFFYNGVVY